MIVFQSIIIFDYHKHSHKEASQFAISEYHIELHAAFKFG